MLLTLPTFKADTLGQGSTQATTDPSSNGKDQLFWDALNANIKNLHAVISGHGESESAILHVYCLSLGLLITSIIIDHGNEWCAREPSKDVIFCFNKHSGYEIFIQISRKHVSLTNQLLVLWHGILRYGGYSKPGWGHGVRNIVFSADPSVGPETWIRFENGDTRARVTLDERYDR